MRDRLIELLRKSGASFERALPEEIADHLLANGVIVPPCCLNQKLYRLLAWRNEVDECKVSSLTQKADGTWKIRVTSGIFRSVFEITKDEIGKTVFLTREEAEKALKGE